MMHSRRQFGKTVLVGLPVAAFAARLDSTVAGVHLGTITYSFRELPRMPGNRFADPVYAILITHVAFFIPTHS